MGSFFSPGEAVGILYQTGDNGEGRANGEWQMADG
jgi:hypothetical protein